MLAWVEAKEMVVQSENQTWAHRYQQVSVLELLKQEAKGLWRPGLPPPSWWVLFASETLAFGVFMCI